jgi:hypothetical protein
MKEDLWVSLAFRLCFSLYFIVMTAALAVLVLGFF